MEMGPVKAVFWSIIRFCLFLAFPISVSSPLRYQSKLDLINLWIAPDYLSVNMCYVNIKKFTCCYLCLYCIFYLLASNPLLFSLINLAIGFCLVSFCIIRNNRFLVLVPLVLVPWHFILLVS